MNNQLGKEYEGFVVSEGTCITEDIVEKISLLVSAGEIVSQKLDSFIDEFYVALGDNKTPDVMDDIYRDICETLTEIAPDNYWFGGHEDDPACVGFWRVEE